MRTKALIALSAVICMAGTPAMADMELAFSNTVVSQYASGLKVRHWFNRDGSYQAFFSDGRRMTGRWTEEGSKVCLNDIRPRMILSRFCTPAVKAEIGATWSSRDPLGRRVHNELVSGR
ncbi:hypothetical protein [Brevundimonas vesicularis]|uniref:hypothetical protein n=1 Tax=Brevundimonas vesicularis TaxID=41276 RepID=UPI0038D3E01E